MNTIVVEEPGLLAAHLPAWDDLAVAGARPCCAPAWMLAWWQEARAGDARLRVVLVFDDHSLIGVGPFFAQVSGRPRLVEMRMLGAGFSHRIGPLARAGAETLVARELAKALHDMRPRPDSVVFEGIDAADRWPELIAGAWPAQRRPRVRTDVRMDAPVIALEGSFDDWLARRERRFRKEARRTWRRMEEEGVTAAIAHDASAIDTLFALHESRWRDRGGSNVGDEGRRVVLNAAQQLGKQGRLLVALLDSPVGPVAAELVVRAGDAAVFWGGGFDTRWARNAPGTQAMLLALQELAASGTVSADLGGGEHDYKRRLADGNHPLIWRTMFPRGMRYPLIRLRLAPKHVRFALREAARRLRSKRRNRRQSALQARQGDDG